MKCPACDDKPPMTDAPVCARCYRHARDLAAHHGLAGEPDDIVLPGFIVWAKQVRKEGGSLNLAVMVETKSAPSVRSDATFFHGHLKSGGAQFDGKHPLVQEAYTRPAKEAGVSLNGKVYMNELAAFPGDPRAWVSDKGEARKLVEERGWSSPDLGVGASKDLDIRKAAPLKSFRDFLPK